MLPEAYISHMTGERIRIKIPSKKGDRAYFLSLKDRLLEFSKLSGIKRVEANPVTGSILVIHMLDPQAIELKKIGEYTEVNHLFRLKFPDPDQNETSVFQRLAEASRGVDGKIRRFTQGEMDLATLAFFALLGVAVVQMNRGTVMVPAITALWYATTLLKDQQKEKNNNGYHPQRTKIKVEEV